MAKRFNVSRWRVLLPISPLFVVLAVYLIACVTLGGGTRAGFISDVALQILAVPLLLWCGWRLIDVPASASRKRALAALVVCLGAVGLPLAHLVPLPPSVWINLPGRADFSSNLAAAGLEATWLPLSVVPRATWLSGLSLLPPMAVFLGALQLSYAERRRFSLVLLSTGFLSVVIGLLQVAQGPTSALRLFAFTNASEAVGFFANRNHYAALLYCLFLITAAWLIAAAVDFTNAGADLRSPRSMPNFISIISGFTGLVILVAAQAMARSRAGLVLTIVAVFGAFAMAYAASIGAAHPRDSASRKASMRTSSRILLAAMAIALLFGAQFALDRIQARFDLDPLSDWRLPFARNTIEAALAYMPFGSGMGTFVPVYQVFEKATDNVAGAYANRAHNDWLELWLEAGLVGLIAMILFLVWLVFSLLRLWVRGLEGAEYRDNLLACSAALSLVMLLAHSTVDYPLRTTALMAVFAMAGAMMVTPVSGTSLPASTVQVDTACEAAAIEDNLADTLSQRHGGANYGGIPDKRSDRPRPFVPAPSRDDWPDAWRSGNDPKPDDTN